MVGTAANARLGTSRMLGRSAFLPVESPLVWRPTFCPRRGGADRDALPWCFLTLRGKISMVRCNARHRSNP